MSWQVISVLYRLSLERKEDFPSQWQFNLSKISWRIQRLWQLMEWLSASSILCFDTSKWIQRLFLYQTNIARQNISTTADYFLIVDYLHYKNSKCMNSKTKTKHFWIIKKTLILNPNQNLEYEIITNGNLIRKNLIETYWGKEAN